MRTMPDPVVSAPASSAAPPAAASPPHTRHHGTFRELLAELNPLQYIPVVGTLYRAITGDSIPEPTREAGSLVVSGLTGGPIGVAINVGALLVEKITGIDPEKIGTEVLASIGIGHTPDAPRPAPAPASPPPPAIQQAAWSPGQLAAYGVITGGAGALRRGSEEGSDVLNTLELRRLDGASRLA